MSSPGVGLLPALYRAYFPSQDQPLVPVWAPSPSEFVRFKKSRSVNINVSLSVGLTSEPRN